MSSPEFPSVPSDNAEPPAEPRAARRVTARQVAAGLGIAGGVALTGVVIATGTNTIDASGELAVDVLNGVGESLEEVIQPTQEFLGDHGVTPAGQIVAAALAGAGLLQVVNTISARDNRRQAQQQARDLRQLRAYVQPMMESRYEAGSAYALVVENRSNQWLTNVSVDVPLGSGDTAESLTINVAQVAPSFTEIQWLSPQGNRLMDVAAKTPVVVPAHVTVDANGVSKRPMVNEGAVQASTLRAELVGGHELAAAFDPQGRPTISIDGVAPLGQGIGR